MIDYCSKTRTFTLNGKSFSYIMYVNEVGMLQNVYYGASVANDEYLTRVCAYGRSPKPDDLNRDYVQDYVPFEYGAYGRGDFRAPSAVIVRKDGFCASRLLYKSHKIYDGVPEVAGMPHARSGGKTLAVTLKDELSPAEITLNYTVWDDSDVLVRNAVIKNTGKEKFVLDRAYSFCTALPDHDYDFMRLQGRWANERIPETTPLGHGTVRIESSRAASSHVMNPFMALIRKNCSESTGECIGINLIYSGSFVLTAECSQDGNLRIQGGINELGFSWTVDGGDSFVTPQAALCYSADGLGHMSREFADFYRDRIINRQKAFARRPIVINNWEGTYFDFDREKLFSIIDAAAPLGIDTFVLDDGWFGKRDSDTSGLGDWFVNTKKLDGGLAAVAERCRKNGMKFGLWFEPEMISEDSDLYRAHPDYAIGKRGVEPCRGRNQLVLDFTRSEVVDHVFRVVSDILESCDISYVKWDMNRNITEFFSASLDAERQGELAHRYILGVYDLAERLTSKFPDVLFEGCAGGGGRFDGGMLYYFPQIWTSDDTDAYERTKIQWGTSLCYPVSAMSCHVSACPNHQTQRTIDFSTRGIIASLGTTGYELDPSKLCEKEKALVKTQIEDYKKIAELVLRGDLYRLINPYVDNYFCEMLVSKDKNHAYLAGERFHGVPYDYDMFFKLEGLDPDKKYMVKELGITAYGKTLMHAGLLLPRLPDFTGFAWHIDAV